MPAGRVPVGPGHGGVVARYAGALPPESLEAVMHDLAGGAQAQ